VTGSSGNLRNKRVAPRMATRTSRLLGLSELATWQLEVSTRYNEQR
jgi:hypothetical protein